MQLGVPTSVPKFVAEWLGKGDHAGLRIAMRTVATFYSGVAILNFLFMLAIAMFWINIFQIAPDKVDTLRLLLFITAVTSLFAIPASILDQMLAGAQELGFASWLQIASSFLTGGLVALVFLQPALLTLTQFYVVRCCLMFLPVPFSLMRWRRYGNLGVFVPGWNLAAVRPMIKYSLLIFVFGIFIILAKRLAPIIVAMRASHDAGGAVADLQIIEGFNLFMSMIGVSLMTALVPHLSGAVARGDSDILRRSIVQGTRVIWGGGALIGFGMIMLAGEGLLIYVGSDFLNLKEWLTVYLCTSLYYLYNTSFASAIMSSDNLAPLGWVTGFACLASVVTTWIFVPEMGVGGAVLGSVAYVSVHFCITHFWYFPRFFKLNPIEQIFRIFLPPVAAGVAMCFVGRWVISYVGSNNSWLNIAIGAISGTLVYSSIVLAIYISPRELKGLLNRIR
jgi:O-antigen/teichoic acid export membrane protein